MRPRDHIDFIDQSFRVWSVRFSRYFVGLVHRERMRLTCVLNLFN
jgi:hypothetical protein